MQGIKFNFDKSLYFKHLEILHSNYFSTVSNFFLISLWLSQDQKMVSDMNIHPIANSTIYYSPNNFCFHGTMGKSEKHSYAFTYVFGIRSTVGSSPLEPVLMMMETAFLSCFFIGSRLRVNLSP